MGLNPQMYACSSLDINVATLIAPSCSTNLMIILGMMQVSKKIPFDDPQVLMGVRALYIVSNVIIVAIYLYIQSKINSKKGDYHRGTSPMLKLDLT